jgi:translocation and assembly module TamB
MKKYRIIFTPIIVIGCIILLLLLFTQTSIFKNTLRNIIITQMNELLTEADFKLEKISGNLFQTISLENVEITIDENSILSIEKIKLKYQIFSLLSRKIEINQFDVVNTILNLEETAAGRWNVTDIIPQKDTADAEDLTAKPFDWQIELQNFSVDNFNVYISLLEKNELIPAKIENLNFQLQASYRKEGILANITDLNFKSLDPDFTLKNLTWLNKLQDNQLNSSLELLTEQNQMKVEAAYDLESARLFSLNLEMQPLYLEEFEFLFTDFPLQEYPLIFITADLKKDHLDSRIDLVLRDQFLSIETSLDSIYNSPQYQAGITMEKINLADWFKNCDLNSHLNLQMEIAGSGIEPAQLAGSIELKSQNSSIGNAEISKLDLFAEKLQDTASINLQFKTDTGNMLLSGKLRDIFEIPVFDLDGSIEQLNLYNITGNDDFTSDLNFSWEISGSGSDLENLKAKFQLDLHPSQFQDYSINSLQTDIELDELEYKINRFTGDLAGLLFDISGNGNIKGQHDLNYNFSLKDFDLLKNFLAVNKFSGELNINGTITGDTADLTNSTNLELSDLIFNDISLDALIINAVIERHNADFNFNSNLDAAHLQVGEFKVNNFNLISRGNLQEFHNQLEITADSVRINSRNTILLDDNITVKLEELRLSQGDLIMATANDSALILLADDKYSISNFDLENDTGSISLDGYYATDNSADFKLNISEFDLAQLNRFKLIQPEIEGILFFDSDIVGNLENPNVTVAFSIRQPQFNNLPLQNISGNLNISANRLFSEFQIIRNELEKISGSAELPVDLTSADNIFPVDEPLEINLEINDLELQFVEEFASQFQNINGIANLNFQVRNTLRNPEFSGNLAIEQGSMEFPLYGLKYSEIKLNSYLSNDLLVIDDIFVKGGKGYLKINGNMNLADFLNRKDTDLEIKIKARDFLAADKRDLELLTDLDLFLQGTSDKPVFGGVVKITRAKIDLDQFRANDTRVKSIDEPLLVQASKAQSDDSLFIKEDLLQRNTDFIKPLTGKLRIFLPRNTWIKNKDMNIEISGDLEIVKTGSYFEIFGYISPVRGNYNLYGKKFNLVDGVISFNGGQQINPFLDLTVENIFRDALRNKRILKIHLEGYALNPEIKFFLDNEMINEADAVSYLLFGKSNNEIGQSEKSQVSQYGQADFARNILTRELGSRIADQIAQKLNLNVIEFSGGDNFKQGSILVGKYITNDLYLSYQKEFSFDQSKEIVPDKVSLEYEISKYFSLQASRGDEKSTGIDLFWKFRRY